MSERLKQYWATKQAGMKADVAGSALIGPLSNLAGYVHGYASDSTKVPDDAMGFVPGVGTSRMERRQRHVRKDLVPKAKWQRGRILSDELATITPILMLSAIGGGIGAASNGKDGAMTGALIGGGAGVAAGLAAALAAAITKRRTREEQTNSEKSPGVLNHLIPGRATYNMWKRIGYSGNYDK